MSGASLRSAAAFASGLLFAIGLGVAGMTRPSKVIGCLDLFGAWDPSLALVMGGAVAVGLVSFPLILRRASPVLVPRFILPARRGIDARLYFGSALFGVGWGLAGVCPGPALVAAVTGRTPLLAFVVAMAAGLFAVDRLAARRGGDEDAAASNAPSAIESTAPPRAAAPAPRPLSEVVETTCG